MSAGLLLNTTICFAIAIICLTFAAVITRNKSLWNDRTKPSLRALISLWSLVAITYLFTAFRMIAAYANNTELDMSVYYVAAIPFAFISVPLAYILMYILTGNKQTSRFIGLIFSIFGLAYLMLLFSQGVMEPRVSYWSSLITVNSDIAINIYLTGLFILPTAMILGIMTLIFLRKVSKKQLYHTTLLLVSISFVIDFMLVDMITNIDVMQLAARIFVLIGSILAYLSYFPPLTLQERLGIEEKHYEPYDEMDEFDPEVDVNA
ncbi:hypothetical protein SAMN04488587_1474 [Methanococcoides vulcani]|uniref:Uncharacterized protein n=1 Tax=Methanococcoides vulcani TaxID=1353158 RepID=A0A1I0A7T4_9EURY|nr:hypothetical protein [Methanococcoides vulcani]SES90228.1 hypothetical protein SAMN04488587_1474 [Methanococcoides vulcani]